jgi:hypothetical protein
MDKKGKGPPEALFVRFKWTDVSEAPIDEPDSSIALGF